MKVIDPENLHSETILRRKVAGTYKCRDEVWVAPPPPHPTEGSLFNANPLSTTPIPPSSGVKLYYTKVVGKQFPTQPPKPQASRLASAFKSSTPVDKLAEVEREARLSEDTNTGTGTSDSGSHPYSNGKSPIYGAGNLALTPGPVKEKDKDKRKKPKTGLSKTSSSFISRYVVRDDLVKRMELRNGEYTTMFANNGRTFCWLDMTDSAPGKENNWAKIMFAKAHPLSHNLNETTKSPQHMDVVVGTNVGDILWYEPVSQRYSRINKNGAINPSAVTEVCWIPGSENLFLAAHLDGTLVVYDKERDDEPFEPEDDPNEHAIETPMDEKAGMDFDLDSNIGDLSLTPGMFHINKSQHSTNQNKNPVAVYRVSNQRINTFAFSPDSRHLAVGSEDGTLRIIDYLSETLLDLYSSFYDGFTCICWSPDGRYVVTGGKDDLVTIWSLHDRQIVARCVGHKSWVSHVAFDPWRCDGRDYRFGSVGEDQRLLIWDFGPGMLHAPRGARRGHKSSVASVAAGVRARAESLASLRLRSTTSLATNGTGGDEDADTRGFMDHQVESRQVVPELVPVFNEVVDDDPMSDIVFTEDCIITACSEGHVKTWDRPKAKRGPDVHRPDTPKSNHKEESHPFQRTDNPHSGASP